MRERIRWDGVEQLKVGHVVKYWYCRGTSHEGVAVMRGQDGFEYWMKTLSGSNHFNTSNFVVTTDVSLCECSEEDFKLYHHR